MADRLAERWKCDWRTEKRFKAEVSGTDFEGKRFWLVKPLTYMNASGEAVAATAHFYRAPAENVLILVDDADLALGTIRMRPSGSSGGHHGLESVEKHLGTSAYPRLRLGIARPSQGVRDIAGYVLSRFAAEDRKVWDKVAERASLQVEKWAAEGAAKAMNLYNGSV